MVIVFSCCDRAMLLVVALSGFGRAMVLVALCGFGRAMVIQVILHFYSALE